MATATETFDKEFDYVLWGEIVDMVVKYQVNFSAATKIVTEARAFGEKLPPEEREKAMAAFKEGAVMMGTTTLCEIL